MSNAIRYDALLVRDLAAELHRTLAGARLDAVFFDREALRVTLRTRAPQRRQVDPPSLVWQLHPQSGHLSAAAPAGSFPGSVQLGTATAIMRVHAPPDERIIVIDLDARSTAPAGAARQIIIELVTNQWNAIAVGADGRITAIVRERETRGRVLRAGSFYERPRRAARAGATVPLTAAEWHQALGPVPPGERMTALLGSAAYTSPLNAAAILADADITADPDALDRARVRYLDMVWTAERRPVLLTLDGRAQPYSRPLPAAGSESAATLLDAFARAADRAAAAPARSDAVDRALTSLAYRIQTIDRRLQRLHAEQDGAGAEAARLRTRADLLLAQLDRVERGAQRVTLDDFGGGSIEIDLDPALSAAANASRLYDTARRRDRAAARIPGLVAAAERERARMERLIERARSGDLDPAELERMRPQRRAAERAAGPALPYREYRTTGGLEVRVGRGSRANDELTFRHSSPTDVWLHARDVAGAHVILRWDRTEENPPSGAVAEAAVLAALFSRARTSGTVAVDWTRRKYVRKPRRSAPGLVLPERVKTVFVEPDPAAEERMRAER